MTNISPCFKFIYNTLGYGLAGVEIGIWDGGNAFDVINYISPRKYYMIDPYIEYGDNNYEQPLYEKMYAGMCERFKNVPNAILMRTTSFEASKTVENNLDFVYVDGAHDYDNKILDLESWYPKIKTGGIICGDDFNLPSVSRAVVDFMLKHGLEFTVSALALPHPIEYWARKVE